MLAQMSGRKFVQKKSMDMSLSFSQANKIYKANSDEFRCIKGKRKKNKLSLSTVSNELTNMQQTVSDMNDSDYRNRVDNNRRCKRRRRPPNNFARRYLDNKNYEFYNGDLLLGPAIKADKPNSNEDKKNYNKKPKIKRKRKSCDNVRPSDVWTMLRNMNRFQCVSSPPISEDSTETIKRREDFVKYPKKREYVNV
ncbi:uncharacterized protein [Battus philenor]|uniref:uncharacterized protein n=1 Tax=Battus philenor TaxID=42288 RepID=UPI0035CF2F50